jgi:hypothetical protein
VSDKTDRLLLDLHLRVSGGAYNAVGALRLFCWLKAIRVPRMLDHGNLVVVHPDPAGGALAAREVPLETRRLEPLVAALRDLGFPAARPQIEEVFDTSDGWEHAVLRAVLDDDSDTLELSFCSSGFKGRDAEGLRRVFREILAIAGVGDRGSWYNLTGRRPSARG